MNKIAWVHVVCTICTRYKIFCYMTRFGCCPVASWKHKKKISTIWMCLRLNYKEKRKCISQNKIKKTRTATKFGPIKSFFELLKFSSFSILFVVAFFLLPWRGLNQNKGNILFRWKRQPKSNETSIEWASSCALTLLNAGRHCIKKKAIDLLASKKRTHTQQCDS